MAIHANTTIEGLASGQKLASLCAPNMQRPFSTFPDGPPGAGLLLLRAAIGGSLLVLGGTYLVPQAGGWSLAIGLVAAVSGASLLIGFLTPSGVLAGLVAIGLALVWRARSPSTLDCSGAARSTFPAPGTEIPKSERIPRSRYPELSRR